MDHHQDLNSDQKDIIHKILKGQNVLITGSAGTGKSYLIRYLRKQFDNLQQTYRIVAPTGVAAVNVGGVTIHKFLGITPNITNIHEYSKYCMKRSKVPWKTINSIIIDEVSMVHPSLFTLFDAICKLHRNSNKPFGGIQIILIGDFFQLCPIKSKDFELGDPEYIFETNVWNQMNIDVNILNQVMRQNEQEFITALNDLRIGLYSENVRNLVLKCSKNKKIDDKHYIKLFSLNVDKAFANDTELAKLHTNEKIYKSIDLGDSRLLKDCRAEVEIKLKIGSPVMLLWNLPEFGLCNGSVGILESFDELTGYPIVHFNNGVKTVIHEQIWTIQENNGNHIKTLASRKQIPLAVAFSISIHKSQGLTIDHLIADCKGIFTTGQLYVLLSRASYSDGLIIKNFNQDHIMIDEKVVSFYNSIQNNQEKVNEKHEKHEITSKYF